MLPAKACLQLVAALTLAVAGCNGGAISNAGDDDPIDLVDPSACIGVFGAPIPNPGVLPGCCEAEGGAAHCFAADRAPQAVKNAFSSCASGGLCVPDTMLETGGSVAPTSCTAFGGDGVCLSVCMPQVAENAALLAQDVCGATERCAPCIHPIMMMPTGACDLREVMVCAGEPLTDPPPPSACDDPATCEYEPSCPPVVSVESLTPCAGDAHCLDRSVIAGATPELVNELAPCTDASMLCVPDVFLETGGKFTPPTCTSVNESEGRCVSRALPSVTAQAAMLPQSSCGTFELCVPCYSPLDSSPTGACATSCDLGPTEPPKPFASCCEGRARCIPTASVPGDQTDNLEGHECDDLAEGAYFCVPNQILNDEPTEPCEADNFLVGYYTGVCLSDCLDFGIGGLAMSGGSCADGYSCAPCENPLTGAPTGAPGCAP